MYFCRQNIQPQENYKDHTPAEVLQRFSDAPRFETLIGSRTHYGWTDDGPDWQAMARNSRAGRTWHA